jgi:hypothetical protein
MATLEEIRLHDDRWQEYSMDFARIDRRNLLHRIDAVIEVLEYFRSCNCGQQPPHDPKCYLILASKALEELRK